MNISHNETYLKIEILSNGVVFSDSALRYALQVGAKVQNNIYNRPKGASLLRPQELLIEYGGYETVVSCISPLSSRDPVEIDYQNHRLYVKNRLLIDGVSISFVLEPDYYKRILSTGEKVTKYVSSCGYDELNIIPWKGCAINQTCSFCGVNTVARTANAYDDARSISNDIQLWLNHEGYYISSLKEAISIALQDEVFNHHAHVILISGNLSDELLNVQSEIYSRISSAILPDISNKSSEGLIAVMAPPHDEAHLALLKQSGIKIVVFNLETATLATNQVHTPGKLSIHKDYYHDRLLSAVSYFGKGNVWSNFVLGLDPLNDLLETCDRLLSMGIVPSTNILHMDEGSYVAQLVPTADMIINFSLSFNHLLKQYGYKPYYCSKALRTSLTNEAYENRIVFCD